MPEAAHEVHTHNSYLSLVKDKYLLHSPLRSIFADPIIGKNRAKNTETTVEQVTLIKISIWPTRSVAPSLQQRSDRGAFIEANLSLVKVLYHQRLSILQFNEQRYLIVQPLLHTSPNLYTKETWEKWIARIPSKRWGYKVLLALDFGEFVLSFNSNDHLASVWWQKGNPLINKPVFSPICSDKNSADFYDWSWKQTHTSSRNLVLPHCVQDAYSKWLKTVARWIGSSLLLGSNQSIMSSKKTQVHGFWMPTKDVCKSPAARMARLCEAAFHIFWEGYLKSFGHIKYALQYDHVTLCATKEDIIRFNSELLPRLCEQNCTSRSMAIIFTLNIKTELTKIEFIIGQAR
ncbi:hypothetical protein K435DRAFT_796819 [Dendrothele bispora CBS 962.96]|uniref:Uncharacterized protein n=1 Tax=Dendrothele bispora (strain CBS 962.96) TaxID=1314807 RepID=A0A4S8M4Y5_DENBC|nr:hypothetical protein K435DRAFT_796819 [Dendrothele bispora CBS 962.96]